MRGGPELSQPDRPALLTAYVAAPVSIAMGLLAGPLLALAESGLLMPTMSPM